MKLVIVLFLALASKIYASNFADYAQEDGSDINSQKGWNYLFKTMTTKSQWRSPASSLSAAIPYKIKVTQRIQNSKALRNMPHIKEKLHKIADEKLDKCATPDTRKLDKHCLGRATGQIMQFISAVENSRRYMI